jgi:hypothetical protein
VLASAEHVAKATQHHRNAYHVRGALEQPVARTLDASLRGQGLFELGRGRGQEGARRSSVSSARNDAASNSKPRPSSALPGIRC